MAKNNFIPLVGGGTQMPASAEAVAADILRLDGAVSDLAEDVGTIENWDAGDIPYDSSENYNDGTVGGSLNDLKSAFDDVTETITATEIELDPDNIVTTWYITSTGGVYSSGESTTRAVYVSITEAGTYYITKNESPKFRIGYTMVTPYVGVSLSGFQNLGTDTSATIQLPSNCYLCICYFVNDSSSIDKDALFESIKVVLGTTEESAIDLKARQALFGKEPYNANEQNFMFDVGGGYKTKGFLKLPPNYTPTGGAVPLIVFVHGSSDISYIGVTTMTQNYQDYYNYLRDCGYAIFDCYAYSDKFEYANYGHVNTWSIPINDACYLSGIRYVCKKWNVDSNNVFVACKSLGGLQAFGMLCKSAFNVKAVGMLAPELAWLGMGMAYMDEERQFNAENMGFSEDTGGVLVWNGGSRPAGYNDYITANIDKWVGCFTNFTGLPITDANKPTYYQSLSGTKTMSRMGRNVPLKIWIAEDDSSVSYANADALVQSLRNGGNKAELRTMPSGTGGHHSVDNDENALQTENVTTSLGIEYESVPTAYYELREFFDQYLSM